MWAKENIHIQKSFAVAQQASRKKNKEIKRNVSKYKRRRRKTIPKEIFCLHEFGFISSSYALHVKYKC